MRTRALGILVGGESSRMGGAPKGLLLAPDVQAPIVVRWLSLARSLGLEPVLLGSSAAYSTLAQGVRSLEDAPLGIGPLGGLSALLHVFKDSRVLLVACDMPRVSQALLERLSTIELAAPIVAPMSEDGRHYEPLFARYDAPRVLPVLEQQLARGQHSLQSLLRALDVEVLSLSAYERHQLVDWDTPEDVGR